MVLKVIREHKLYAKLIKCDFYHKQIHYLGHIISKERILENPKKIKPIMNWPTSKNVIDVRSLRVLLVICIRFIEGVFKIAPPTTSLKNKGVKFEWTQICEKRFQLLKKILTSALILKIANPNKDFVLFTDACRKGLGRILIQDNYVVCYE